VTGFRLHRKYCRVTGATGTGITGTITLRKRQNYYALPTFPNLFLLLSWKGFNTGPRDVSCKVDYRQTRRINAELSRSGCSIRSWLQTPYWAIRRRSLQRMTVHICDLYDATRVGLGGVPGGWNSQKTCKQTPMWRRLLFKVSRKLDRRWKPLAQNLVRDTFPRCKCDSHSSHKRQPST
jgi:hypothetical protein